MQASVEFRSQHRDLGMVMREVDEDLAIFLGMGNSEKERIEDSDEFDGSTGTLLPRILLEIFIFCICLQWQYYLSFCVILIRVLIVLEFVFAS